MERLKNSHQKKPTQNYFFKKPKVQEIRKKVSRFSGEEEAGIIVSRF